MTKSVVDAEDIVQETFLAMGSVKAGWQPFIQYAIRTSLKASKVGRCEVFKVLMDFGQWSQWTASITGMSILNNDRPGTGAKIKVLMCHVGPLEGVRIPGRGFKG
jgi:hypothetical protein